MDISKQYQAKLRYFKPLSRMNVQQHNYETRRDNYEGDTFRRKKKSDCYQLNYSSCLNPFARSTFNRYDYQRNQFQRKKKLPYASGTLTDPVTLKFQMPQKKIRTRPQFRASIIYQHEMQKTCFLPSQRSVSPSRRQYYPLMNQSYSLQKFPRPRDTQNSQRLRHIIQYAQADHEVKSVTPKVGKRK